MVRFVESCRVTCLGLKELSPTAMNASGPAKQSTSPGGSCCLVEHYVISMRVEGDLSFEKKAYPLGAHEDCVSWTGPCGKG